MTATRRAGYIQVAPNVAIVGSGELGLSGPIDCHVYLIRTGDGSGVLIDAGAGPDAADVSDNLRQAGVERGGLQAILLTHAHADHAGGSAALATDWAASVYTSAPEAAMLRGGSETELGLVAAKRNGTYPRDYQYRHMDSIRVVADGDTLSFGSARITALVLPGHTAGSVVWLVELPGYRALFTGDTVFAGGLVSVLNLPGSEASAYRSSLPRLASVTADGFFPGHGTFAVFGGMRHVRLAAERMLSSVIPNYAIPRWSPPALPVCELQAREE